MKDILIIDDEQDVLDIVRAVLNTKGYHIRMANGGEEGIRKAKQKAPDLIICDLMMPRVSGREVIKQVKEDEVLKDVPFITVSAVGGDQNKPESFWAQGLGVDEYLFKPFDPMDLLGKVEALLRQSEYEAEKEQRKTQTDVQEAPVAKPKSEVKLPPVDTPPGEIAQMYLECWNNENWALEYNLMAEEMTSAYSLDQYATARRNAKQENPEKKIEFISRPVEKISANMATVTIERKDTMGTGRREHLRKSTVTLRKSDKGWRVLKAKEESL